MLNDLVFSWRLYRVLDTWGGVGGSAVSNFTVLFLDSHAEKPISPLPSSPPPPPPPPLLDDIIFADFMCLSLRSAWNTNLLCIVNIVLDMARLGSVLNRVKKHGNFSDRAAKLTSIYLERGRGFTESDDSPPPPPPRSSSSANFAISIQVMAVMVTTTMKFESDADDGDDEGWKRRSWRRWRRLKATHSRWRRWRRLKATQADVKVDAVSPRLR